MNAFFKLLRIENVLMVVLTQLLMSYAVIFPILSVYHYESSMPWFILVLLITGTALITMGGYVINDYFDTRIDEINKPHKVLIGRAISRHKAMTMHQILTVIGVLCGLVVAWQVWSLTVAMVFVFIPGLLWFYSTTYKRQFLIGNIIVASITAFVPLIVAIVENDFLVSTYGVDLIKEGVVAEIYLWVGFFALFSFITNLLREIVKDMEDEPGDRELECRTLPIVLGRNVSKAIVIMLTVVAITGIIYIIENYLQIPESSFIRQYLWYAVIAPLLFFMFMIKRAKTAIDFKYSQLVMKVIMVLGLLFSLVFAYTI